MADENKIQNDDLETILSEINETIQQKKHMNGGPLSSDFREMLDRMAEEQEPEQKAEPVEPEAPKKPKRGRPPKKKPAETIKETEKEQPKKKEEPVTEPPLDESPREAEEASKEPEQTAEAPVAEPVSEQTPAEPDTKQPPVRRAPTRKGKIGSAILGGFLLLFVIIGLVASVRQIWKFGADVVNQTKLKEELAVLVFPLVIVDVPEFDDPTKLDSSVIMSSSIWKFIIDKTDKSTYRRNDLGMVEVPNVDIEREVRRLYGSQVEIVHQSMDDGIIQMSYSETSNNYYVETVPHSLPYTPRVDDIVKDGDIYTLRVSYLLPDVLWNLADIKSTQVWDKVMEYRLQKTGDDYQVLSVKLLEVNYQAPDPLPEEDMNLDMGDILTSSEVTSSDSSQPEDDTTSSAASN